MAKPLTDLFIAVTVEPALKNLFCADDSLFGDFENLLTTAAEIGSTDAYYGVTPNLKSKAGFCETIVEVVFTF